jgi:hypothetical protein
LHGGRSGWNRKGAIDRVAFAGGLALGGALLDQIFQPPQVAPEVNKISTTL